MTTRFLINPEGQTDDEIVDFIMGIIEESGGLEEARLVEHPGHGDEGVHAGGRRGIAEPITAANAIIAGKQANVSSADLDDALYHLAANAPYGTNLMPLHVDGKRMTGDLGLPVSRDKMPQFDGDNKTDFVNEMASSGVRVTRKKVDPSTLTPGQNEIDARKTSEMFADIDKGKAGVQDPILVSSDGKVMDGNHRYAALSAARQDGHPGATIEVIEIGMPSKDLLPLMQTWVAARGIATRKLGT